MGAAKGSKILPNAAGEHAAASASRGMRHGNRKRLGGRRPGLVLVVGCDRRFLGQGHDRPQVLCRPGHAEARHAGELDAVLDRPEQLRRGPCSLAMILRSAGTGFSPRNISATSAGRRDSSRTRSLRRRVRRPEFSGSSRLAGGVSVPCATTEAPSRSPAPSPRYRRIIRGFSDIVEAAEEINRSANGGDDR